ncbi:hypothetical protein FOL46_002728 [Perkinsus olseni]|uniref:Uncharacterized protein n=1 Tax=Perkinsus olseni TaxID=32597 RepID=A0A7J6MUA5_PEROL|nr:hypothetical protein FOL46_002728 [Perkinsus olseni]
MSNADEDAAEEIVRVGRPWDETEIDDVFKSPQVQSGSVDGRNIMAMRHAKGASTTASSTCLSAEVYNDVLLQKQDEIFKLGQDMTRATTEGHYKKAASLRKHLREARQEYDTMIEKRVEYLAGVKQEQLTESWRSMRCRFEKRFIEERKRIEELVATTKNRLSAEHEREVAELEEAFTSETADPRHSWSSTLRELMKTEQRLAAIGDFDAAEQCRVRGQALRQKELEDHYRKRQHQFEVNKRHLQRRHASEIEAVARRGDRMMELARRNYITSSKALDAKSKFIAKKVNSSTSLLSYRGTLHPSIEPGLPTVLGSVTCVKAEYRSGTDCEYYSRIFLATALASFCLVYGTTGRPAPLAETSVRSGEEIEAERVIAGWRYFPPCRSNHDLEPMEEESTGELPDDMFQPINSLDSGAGTGGVPWISPARSRTGGRISSASEALGSLARLEDESDSDMNQNRNSEDEEEEEELPLTTSEEPSPTKPRPNTNTPGVQRMDTAVLCGTEKESASRETRQVCSTENNACVAVDAGVKAVSQPLNHASRDVTKNSSCVSTELGGSQRSNVVIRRWITPPTRTTIRSHTAAAIRPSYGMAMTPPVLFPQYRLVSPIAAAASFTPPTGLARSPVQITQSVPLRRRYQQSPVTSTITRMGTQDWIPLPRP